MSKHIAASGVNQGKWVRCNARVNPCELGAHVRDHDLNAIKHHHSKSTGEKFKLADTPATAVADFMLATDEEKENIRSAYKEHNRANAEKRERRRVANAATQRSLRNLARYSELQKLQKKAADDMLKGMMKDNGQESDAEFLQNVKKAVHTYLKDDDGTITKNVQNALMYHRMRGRMIDESTTYPEVGITMGASITNLRNISDFRNYHRRAHTDEEKRKVFVGILTNLHKEGAVYTQELEETRAQQEKARQAQEIKDKRKQKLKRFFGLS